MRQHGRVLIVDDNAMNVDVLRRILRKDYELDTAASGDECLAKLSPFKPQLVLLDIMMPGMNGYETCRRIKSSPLGDSVQVILVSGKGTTADRVHGYEALADDYIVKPFDHAELLFKVRAYFRLRKLGNQSERHEAHEAFARLCSLVNQMTADIDEHTNLIEQIQRELSVSRPESPDALIHAMVRLADTNKATQERLASAERKLREQAQEIESHASEARTDALTLLPNRRAFDEELARRIAEADRLDRHLYAIMIDIDHFKHFNDRYGHPTGDKVLQAMGRVLGRAIRQTDVVARYGGDEFAALMPARSSDEARCGARHFREAIETSSVYCEDRTLQVTASIGLAERQPGEDGLSLIKRADEALYASKKAGRNCVHWHDGKETRPVANAETPPVRQPKNEPLLPSPFPTLRGEREMANLFPTDGSMHP
jgi:diguanylate cyclase